MFTETKVKQVMDSLQQVFASEAHFQLAFALQAKELFGKQFEYYPEVPVRKDSKVKKRDEFDLLVQDEKSIKTLIEFKYKIQDEELSGQFKNA